MPDQYIIMRDVGRNPELSFFCGYMDTTVCWTMKLEDARVYDSTIEAEEDAPSHGNYRIELHPRSRYEQR